MMRWFAFVVSFALVALAACGDNMPPIIGEGDSGGPKDVYVVPCSTPATGCPCEEAGVSEVCGTEFHYSGNYVTCSKQYITCGDDGTWGPCVGAIVFGAE
jgi:hypothetical protein